jgi:hypothetical protein
VVHELAVNVVSLVIGESSLEAVQGWLLVSGHAHRHLCMQVLLS